MGREYKKDEQPQAAPSSMPVPQVAKPEEKPVEVKMPQLVDEKKSLFDPAEELLKQQEADKKKSVEIVDIIAKYPDNKPLQVVALRAGFVDGVRRAEGDKFTIKNKSKLGSWMKPILL